MSWLIRAELLQKLDKALERMEQKGCSNTRYYKAFKAKRDLVAAGYISGSEYARIFGEEGSFS